MPGKYPNIKFGQTAIASVMESKIEGCTAPKLSTIFATMPNSHLYFYSCHCSGMQSSRQRLALKMMHVHGHAIDCEERGSSRGNKNVEDDSDENGVKTMRRKLCYEKDDKKGRRKDATKTERRK